MTRDWIWAFVAAMATVVLTARTVRDSGLLEDAAAAEPWLVYPLVIVVFTVVLYVSNRHSNRRLRRAGRKVGFVVKPLWAVRKAASLFPLFFVLLALMDLALGRGLQWDRLIPFSGILAYLHALTQTGYRRPSPYA